MAARADALESPRLPGALGIGLIAGVVPVAVALAGLPTYAIWVFVVALACAPLALVAFAYPKKWALLFCVAAILLPPIPFPIGDSGAHLSVAIAGIGMLAGVARIREWRIEKSPLNMALVALVGAFALSLGFAVLYSGAAVAGGSAVRLFLFSCSVFVYFTSAAGPGVLSRGAAWETVRWIFFAAFAAAVFGCIDFFYQLPAPGGFGAQFIWLSTGVYRRAQGVFYDASALGNFCALFLVGCVVVLGESKKRRVVAGWVAGVMGVVFLAALGLSYSRGAMGTAVVGCAGVVLGRRVFGVPGSRKGAKALRRTLLVMGVLGIATGAAFLWIYPEFARAYWSRFANITAVTPDAALSGRLESWSAILGFIGEHPVQTFLGIGYKTLPYTTYLGSPVIADNNYLSVLVEAGVLGLVALLAVNVAILRTCWTAARRGSFYGRWMFCFWIGEMFQMLTGDVLTFWRVLPVCFWLLAQAVLERDVSEDFISRSV